MRTFLNTMFEIFQNREAAAETSRRAAKARGGPAIAFALAVVALGLLLLRPICDSAFTAAGHGGIATAITTMIGHTVAGHPDPAAPQSEVCCASVADETLLKPAEPRIASLPDAPLGAAFFLLAALPLFASSRTPARFCLAAPPERSFYARSARILR